MIFYFSAEGNSRYIAEEAGKILDEEVSSILSVPAKDIKFQGKSLGIVFPIYSWGVPPIVTEYVKSLSDSFVSDLSGKKIWMICTCGDDVGMAPEMLKKTLACRGLSLSGGWSLQMPNTYVVLPGFDVDSAPLAHKKLEASVARIAGIADKIKNEDFEENYVRGALPRLKTALVFPLFKRWGINTTKWHATDACVGCGICAAACPVSNIKMHRDSTGHLTPRWGSDCISCMACYHSCPRHAVAYGSITRKKGQYIFPKSNLR